MPSKRRPKYRKPILVKTPEGDLIPRPQIFIQGKGGRFIPLKDRYTDKALKVWSYHRGWIPVWSRYSRGRDQGRLTPQWLVNFLRGDEFERLPEAVTKYAELVPKGRYQAWSIGQQLARRRGIQGKLMKLIIEVRDGKRLRKLTTYTRISKGAIGVNLWGSINRAVGAGGFFLYDRFGGKLLVDRVGRKVKLEKVTMFEVL